MLETTRRHYFTENIGSILAIFLHHSLTWFLAYPPCGEYLLLLLI